MSIDESMWKLVHKVSESNVKLKSELAESQSTIAAMTETAKDANASYIAQHNEILLLKAQLAEAQSYKSDAERYRWLSSHYDDFLLIQVDYSGSEIESMIDQAMKERE